MLTVLPEWGNLFFISDFVSPDSSTCRFVSMQSLQLFTGETHKAMIYDFHIFYSVVSANIK